MIFSTNHKFPHKLKLSEKVSEKLSVDKIFDKIIDSSKAPARIIMRYGGGWPKASIVNNGV